MTNAQKKASAAAVVAVLAGIFVSTDLAAQEQQSADARVVEAARELLEANEAEEAFQFLHEMLESTDATAEYYFLLGMACMETMRPAEAADYFEMATQHDPPPRVRLELARAYDAVGRYDRARDQFNHVLDTEPPPEVRNNIERYLSRLDEQKHWRLRLSAGYLYDDNVTAGPDSDTVELFGIPFELDPDARERSDSAVTTDAVFDHQLPLTNHYSLRSNLSFSSTTYFSESRFNSESLSVSVGPSLLEGRLRVGLPATIDYSRLGSERYAIAYGLGPRAQYRLGDRWLVQGALTGQIVENWQRPARDGYIWSGRLSARYHPTAQSYIEAGYRYRRESADEDFLSNDLHELFAAYYTDLPWRMSFFIRPRIGWNKYDEAEAAFGRARDETRFSLDLNLSKEIADSGFVAALGYTFTNNDSNIGFYEFDRNQVTLQVSKRF